MAHAGPVGERLLPVVLERPRRRLADRVAGRMSALGAPRAKLIRSAAIAASI